LTKNKEAFIYTTTEEIIQSFRKYEHDSVSEVLKILKATVKTMQQLTDDQEEYLR